MPQNVLQLLRILCIYIHTRRYTYTHSYRTTCNKTASPPPTPFTSLLYASKSPLPLYFNWYLVFSATIFYIIPFLCNSTFLCTAFSGSTKLEQLNFKRLVCNIVFCCRRSRYLKCFPSFLLLLLLLLLLFLCCNLCSNARSLIAA